MVQPELLCSLELVEQPGVVGGFDATLLPTDISYRHFKWIWC